jgi:hypothetical protein
MSRSGPIPRGSGTALSQLRNRCTRTPRPSAGHSPSSVITGKRPPGAPRPPGHGHPATPPSAVWMSAPQRHGQLTVPCAGHPSHPRPGTEHAAWPPPPLWFPRESGADPRLGQRVRRPPAPAADRGQARPHCHRQLPSLRNKHVPPHTCAMNLPRSGVDTATIAHWPGRFQ